MKHKLLKDKSFYITMLSIALPIALQNLISSSLNMVDTILIGQLGDTEIAAVGLANQYFFLFNLLLFGTNSGLAIFISQFWGKEDVTNIRRVLGISIVSGAIISLIFAAGAFFNPGFIMRIFTTDPAVIDSGSKYLRIIALSYTITAVSFSFSFASRSVRQPVMPMVVSGVSLGINTILNYLLIFGKYGFPRMEVRGSALATLIARAVELSLLIMVVYTKRGPLAGKFREFADITREFALKLFKTAVPVILNEGLWSLGITMYSVAYARQNTSSIAAVQISNTVQNIFMVICFGLGNASAVMIGNKLGANKKDIAVDYAKKFSIIGPAIGILLGVFIIVLSPTVLSFFKVTYEVHNAASKVLIVLASFTAIRVFNIIMVVGILRSGGDTKFSLYLEAGSVWIVGVPFAFLGAIVWKLPIHWVVFLVSLEEVVKASIGIPRIVSKRWVKNVVENL